MSARTERKIVLTSKKDMYEFELEEAVKSFEVLKIYDLFYIEIEPIEDDENESNR